MPGSIVPSGGNNVYTSLSAVLKVEGAEKAARELKEFTQFSEKADAATEKLRTRLSSFAKSAALFSSVITAIGAGTIGKFTASAVRTSMEFEKLDVQMRAMTGSARSAELATKWVKKFTMDTPYQLQQTTEAFIKLKAFGLDPMSGSMQAIADQAAKLGGSADTMGTIILALGKAWSRGKMEGEDFNMMLEKGVPVTRLLAETLSITEEEVLSLRESGLLGRDAIQALIDAMKMASEGASKAFMETLPGKISNLADAWAEAQDAFARKGGVTEALKEIVDALQKEVLDLLQSGEWARAGSAIAAALRPVAEAIPRITLYLRATIETMWELRSTVWSTAKFFAGMWVVSHVARYLDYLNRVIILTRALLALHTGSKFLMFGEMQTASASLLVTLKQVYPQLTAIGPAVGAVAKAATNAALRMYAFQASLMAAYLAAQGLAWMLDQLNNQHLQKGSIDYAQSPTIQASNQFFSRLRQQSEQDAQAFVDFADKFQGKTTQVIRLLETARRAMEQGASFEEATALLPHQIKPYFNRWLAVYSEEYDKVIDEMAKKNKEKKPEVSLLDELEEQQKKWEGERAELGQQLLAMLKESTEEEKLQAAIKQTKMELENKILELLVKQKAERAAQIDAEFEQRNRLSQQIRNSGTYDETGVVFDESWDEQVARARTELLSKQKSDQDDLAKAAKKYWDDQMKDVEIFGRTFSDLMGNIMVGDLENFSQIWTKIWQQMASSMIDMLGTALMNTLSGRAGTNILDAEGNVIGQNTGIWDALTGRGGSGQFEDGSWGKYTAGESAASVVGGAGMVMAANQQGGWGGALQGAMGGAMMGAPWAVATGGVSMIVGAIIGGIAGYFGGSDTPTPTTTFRYNVTGGMFMDAQDQGETAQKIQTFTQAITVAYREIAEDWRDTLRLFDDPTLFRDIGSPVALMQREYEMSMQDLTTWLTQSKLPTEFQHRYQNMIKKGLRNLGLTVDSANEVFAIIRELPGEQRVEALQSVIRALTLVRDLLEIDFVTIEAELDRSFVDEYVESMNDARVAMAMLTTGWEDMDLVERAEDLEEIGMIFENALEATKSALQQIDQIIRQLQDTFDALRESFTTKGMEDDQLYDYYNSQYNKYAVLLANTDDPILIAEYTQKMLEYLGLAADMISPEQWKDTAPGTDGMTYQEWYLKELARLEELALAAEIAQRERIQAQYDALYAQLEFIRSQYEVFGEAAITATEQIILLGGAAGAVKDILNSFIPEGENKSLTTGASITTAGTKSYSSDTQLPQIVVNPPQVTVNISGSLGALRPMVQSIIREATQVRRQSKSIS